jgi:[ribosomal protein S18]-alanine N-acetyltransferase
VTRTGPVVRAAAPDDLAPLLSLEADAFGPDAWTEAVLAEALAGAGRRTVVAADPGSDEVLGYAVSRVAGDVVDLERIVVRRDARRRGVAGELLADLLAHPGGADRMLLEVSAANSAAVAFYVRHGFSQIDVRPRYYRDGTDALVLRRALLAGCGLLIGRDPHAG